MPEKTRNETAKVTEMRGQTPDGTLPAVAWPGGYPLYYLDSDGEILCAKCANENDDFTAKLIDADVHWEGPPMVCGHCNGEIESAYGDPDAFGDERNEQDED